MKKYISGLMAGIALSPILYERLERRNFKDRKEETVRDSKAVLPLTFTSYSFYVPGLF